MYCCQFGLGSLNIVGGSSSFSMQKTVDVVNVIVLTMILSMGEKMSRIVMYQELST